MELLRDDCGEPGAYITPPVLAPPPLQPLGSGGGCSGGGGKNSDQLNCSVSFGFVSSLIQAFYSKHNNNYNIEHQNIWLSVNCLLRNRKLEGT